MPDYAQVAQQDGYGHYAPLTGPALTCGGTVTTASAGVITIPATGLTAGGGSVAFATGQTAVDLAGSFQVTAGTAPTAGTVATVTFANGLPALPKAILATMYDTDGDQNDALGAVGITANAFTLVTDLTGVASELYTVQYAVIV